MRLRIITLTAIALAAITFLAGCSKDATNANGTNTASTNNARPSPSPIVAQPSPTATTPTSASTPTEAFNTYYDAIKRKDVNAFKNLLSKGTLEMLEEQAKRQNKTIDAALNDGIVEASKEVPATVPPTRNEKVDGDKATLEVNDEKKGKWETLHFVRDAGQWKISFDAGEAK